MNFFHRLFNPHCPDCIEQARELNHCNSCEILQLEITKLRIDNNKLLDVILNKNNSPSLPINIEDMKPIQSKHIPWAVKRQQLEADDRRIAERLKSEAPTPKIPDTKLEELEEEILNAKG